MNRLPDHRTTRLPDRPSATCAVLLSGGLDSAVLLAEESARFDVQPIYVSVGLAWEAAERAVIARLLDSELFRHRLRPLASLGVDMRDVYGAAHWAVQGCPPAYATADDEVYLPGRNIILLSKAAVYCAASRIGRLALGTLAHNPFPDATAQFRGAMAEALSLGLAYPLQIEAPLSGIGKAEVIRRGAARHMTFQFTLSCMSPVGTRHCGMCSKCRERHDGFIEAGTPDPTDYVDRRWMERVPGA
jgi:7-cyano-7-deazaguanine synthase